MQRKDIVYSPYPFGDKTKSNCVCGERSQLDPKKTHLHGMMRPGISLGMLEHSWGLSEDINGNRILTSAQHSSRSLGPHILFPSAVSGAELGTQQHSSGPGCCMIFIVHKAELTPLKGHCRAGVCAQPTLSPCTCQGGPTPCQQRCSQPLAPFQARSMLRAAGQAAAVLLPPLTPKLEHLCLWA